MQALWATANREAHEAAARSPRRRRLGRLHRKRRSHAQPEPTWSKKSAMRSVSAPALAEHLPPDVGPPGDPQVRPALGRPERASTSFASCRSSSPCWRCSASPARSISPPRRRGRCARSASASPSSACWCCCCGRSAATSWSTPLVANPAAKPAVHEVWGIATSLLKSIATSTIAFGLLVFLAAWLAGPTGIATALRREAAPYVRAHWAVAYGAAAVIFLILVAWAPVQAFHKLLGILAARGPARDRHRDTPPADPSASPPTPRRATSARG